MACYGYKGTCNASWTGSNFDQAMAIGRAIHRLLVCIRT
jgi:hypothetical protein